MDEIGWSVFRSKRRNSMGEIGLGAVRVSEIFPEITPESSGGPPTNSSAVKEISIFRHRNTQHAKWDQKARRVSPEIFTKAAGGNSERVQQYTCTAGLVPSLGVISKPLPHAVLSEQRCFSHSLPRSEWTGAVLYRSDHTRGVIMQLPRHTALS